MSVPRLRFPGFVGEWGATLFSELCDLKGRIGYRGYTVDDIVGRNDGAIALSPSNISAAGAMQSKNDTYISWFKYEESPEIMVENGHILLVKTGSTYGKSALVEGLTKKATVNPQIVVIKPNGTDSRFLYSIVIGSRFQKQIHETVVGGALPTLSQASVLSFSVFAPTLPEQKKIASFLGVVDAKIAALRVRVLGLQTYKRGLMQALFSQTLRFTRPDGTAFPDWEEKRLGEVATRCKAKNGDLQYMRVLTNSAVQGVVDQGSYFDKDIANAENLGGYYIVKKGDFVYNPRISVTAPVGPIKRNDLGDGVMSPLYTVFRFNEKNTDFFDTYLDTTMWHDYMKSVANYGARHDRMAISIGDFMDLPLPFPHPDEQAKIAAALSAMDAKIAAVSTQVAQMQAFKKGLLQQMFV